MKTLATVAIQFARKCRMIVGIGIGPEMKIELPQRIGRTVLIHQFFTAGEKMMDIVERCMKSIGYVLLKIRFTFYGQAVQKRKENECRNSNCANLFAAQRRAGRTHPLDHSIFRILSSSSLPRMPFATTLPFLSRSTE